MATHRIIENLMDLACTTPASVPAISLLLLAFTNRFLTLANLMRDLYARYKKRA